jgi:hypothetical protein
MVISMRRHGGPLSDPDSLAAKLALVAESKALLQNFEGLDNCPHPEKCLPMENGTRYRLGQWPGYYGLDRDYGSIADRDSLESTGM